VKLIALAIQKSGITTSEGIRAEISKIKDYQGVCGKTSVLENGDLETPIILKVIQDGKVSSAK